MYWYVYKAYLTVTCAKHLQIKWLGNLPSGNSIHVSFISQYISLCFVYCFDCFFGYVPCFPWCLFLLVSYFWSYIMKIWSQDMETGNRNVNFGMYIFNVSPCPSWALSNTCLCFWFNNLTFLFNSSSGNKIGTEIDN